MIPDGYSQVFTGFATIVYRPMLRPERKSLLNVLSGLSKSDVQEWEVARIYHQAISRHLVFSSIDIGDASSINPGVKRPAWWKSLVSSVVGVGNSKSEAMDVRNLKDGYIVLSEYPHLEKRGCDYCKEHWYDPRTGETSKLENGKRPVELPVLCEDPLAKCPLGHHSNPFKLSEKNRQAIRFDAECRASGNWPDDPIVRRNARVITDAIKLVRARRRGV